MNAARPWWLRPPSASLLTAVMLFPVYWMINVSLTPTTRHAQEPART